MSEVPWQGEVYAALQQAARLVDVDCSSDRVLPVLAAYESALTEAGIVLTVLSGDESIRELDYTITLPPGIDDPYAVALSNGLIAKTDHPVDSLQPALEPRLPRKEYLIDAGVTQGFKKVYVHFPRDPQDVHKLAEMPAMPPAVAENADFFVRHGLRDVVMIAIDYRRQTVNLYFARPPSPFAPEPFERGTVLSMLGEAELPEPSKLTVEFAREAFRVNVTLNWNSTKVVRVALARLPGRRLNPSEHFGPVDSKLEQFLRDAPHTYAGETINLLGVKWTRDGEILEFGSYYRLSATQRAMWHAAYGEQL